MSRYSLLFLFSISLLLYGCSSTPATPQIIPASPSNQPKASQAEQFLQNEQYAEAAKLYQQLAENESPEQNEYRLQAIEALIKSGNNAKAEKYAASFDPAKLLPYQRNKLYLLQAQMNLNSGNAEQALKYLHTITAEQLNHEDKIAYHESLAFSYSLTGQINKSIAERITLNQWPITPEQQYKNYAAILSLLSMQPADSVVTIKAGSTDELSGWIALSTILNTSYEDTVNFENAIEDWRQTYPRHPANSEFLNQYLAKGQTTFIQPNSIAVLLPESGNYATYARAIREGLLAAYHSQENGSFKPDIRFYDTQSMDPTNLYLQAVSEGADLIIGPLIKENIKTLATNTELSVPVLALNNIPELAVRNLYQFGLSPVDEADQVATKAGFDGYRRALILVPENKLGQRVANHYADQWQLIGNEVLQVQSYSPQGNDFTLPIKQILNLDESEYRYKKIRNVVPGIKYTPRRRQDVDVIFVTGTAKTMRLLNPQLRYYRANDIPVYATPQLYDGHPNPTLDIDLDGITFCDAPWLFKEIYQSNLSMDNLQHIWKEFPANHLRLVALGIDVYQIIPHLDTLASINFPGATGNLQLTRNNHIKRNLVCAKFANGEPKVIGFINNTDNEYEYVNIVDTPQ